VTGRSQGSAERAVASLKEESKNPNIHYALADMSVQSQVVALAKDLLCRFPKIDELVNNAGNLSTGEPEMTSDGVGKNVAVNIVAPLILSRSLIPALKAATPTGKVQITSGGLPIDTIDMDDLDGSKLKGLPAYSHSKRVMEAMAIALSKELEADGIVVNVVGGGLGAASAMTKAMGFEDLPWYMKIMYPLVRMIFAEDGGKGAKKAAQPVIWATSTTAEELGTGKHLLAAPEEGKFKPEVLDKGNQEKVLKFIESKIVVVYK
jgi:NAD(P)-dependent dehydrogenase (short-subunit alcohol dehydrogenase family)